MKLMVGSIGSAPALLRGFLFQLGVTDCTALSPDRRLLSLVPADAELVPGARAPSQPGRRLHFLLIAPGNHSDFADFLALVGTDPSHVIREIIFTATFSGPVGDSHQHSLLVGGHFDSTRIFESLWASSKIGNYHGVPILEVEPFERERMFFHDKRLLAIIDSRLAMFGTVSSVEQEIYRYLTTAAPNPSMIQKLELLRNKDETWCLISSLELGADIRGMVEKLDPELGKLIENSHGFQFGTRYRRRFEIEYVVDPVAATNVEDISNSRFPVGAASQGRWSLSSNSATLPMGGLHGIVKISRSRYDTWLAKFAPH